MLKMISSDMSYKRLPPNQYYVDKSGVLESELKKYPSIYLEGMAASGKTTAVKMLLTKHNEVNPFVFQMKEEMKQQHYFREKLQKIRSLGDEENIWIILEDMPGEVPEKILEDVKGLIQELPPSWRVIIIGREEIDEIFLELLWKRKMELLSPETLLFTKDEIREFAEEMKSEIDPEEIYKVTGGWAGCVDMILRLSEKKKSKDCSEDTAENLRKRYEIDRYIRREIWDTLSPDEKDVLCQAEECPWINEELCSDVWKKSEMLGQLKKLERKGFFLYESKKNRWKVTPVFRQCILEEYQNINRSDSHTDLMRSLGEWYEIHGYIREALYCLKQVGEEEIYRTCILRHYMEVPFLGISFDEVMEWEECSSKICYLRAVCCYYKQDWSGFRLEIQRVRQETDEKAEEVYLNLLYMDPEEPLENWLSLLENYKSRRGQMRLYNIIGNSCSFLCGFRDLSGLFCGMKKEKRKKENIWKGCLGEEEWKVYLLAEIEYYIEIKREEDIKDENLVCLFDVWETENWQVYLAKLHLFYKLEQINHDDRIVDEIERQKRVLRWEENPCCEKNMQAIENLNLLWNGEQKNMLRWINAMRNESMIAINEENYIALWYLIKGCLHLNRYEKANIILQRLLPYFQICRKTRFLAEGLFLMALTNWAEGKKNQALRYMIESFLVTGDYRYVKFYTEYGKMGCELLEEYEEWMRTNSPEGWHRKKKYNYGNVLRMPTADYVAAVMRLARKNQKQFREVFQETVAEKLTMMEMIVLQDISMGMTNEQICRELNLKLPTVKGHLYSLYKKLEVNSRVKAIVKGREMGLLK